MEKKEEFEAGQDVQEDISSYQSLDTSNGIDSFGDDSFFDEESMTEDMIASFQQNAGSDQAFIDEMNSTMLDANTYELDANTYELDVESDESLAASAEEFIEKSSEFELDDGQGTDFSSPEGEPNSIATESSDIESEHVHTQSQELPELAEEDDGNTEDAGGGMWKIYALIAVMVFTIVGGVGFAVSKIFFSQNHVVEQQYQPQTSASNPVQSQVQDDLVVEAQQLQQAQNSDQTPTNDQSLFNGLTGVQGQSNKYHNIDIANQDPAVRALIESQNSEISALKSQIISESNEKEQLADVAAENERLLSIATQNFERAKNNVEILKAEKSEIQLQFHSKSKALQETVSDLKAELVKRDEKIATLQESISLQQNVAADRAADDSNKIAELANQVASLTEAVNKSMSAKKKAPRKPLAELRFIGTDYKNKQVIYEVYRSGAKDKEPIRLSKDETLFGRGKIANIDDYGCITFTNGKNYQAMNAKCR